jgi:ankyrin repeat protein
MTALMNASLYGRTDTVALLLDRGANIETKDTKVYLNTAQSVSPCVFDHFYRL